MVEAIQYTIAHDDGVGHEDWEQADIVLAGVSRSSKTPTSIYLANRGYTDGFYERHPAQAYQNYLAQIKSFHYTA